MEKEKREELEAANGGRIITVSHMGETFAFRYPTRAEVKMFRQTGKRDPEMAGENMLSQCVIFPGQAALSGFFDRYPFATDAFFACVSKAAGLSPDLEPDIAK